MLKTIRSGTSLLEIVCALALIAILISLASMSFTRARDVIAVRGARSAVVSASARARALSVGHGGSSLAINTAAGTMRITTRDGAIDQVDSIFRELGVHLQFDGAHPPPTATIAYDGLGIGRVASRTISITRAAAAGGVTFSSYGRAREW